MSRLPAHVHRLEAFAVEAADWIAQRLEHLAESRGNLVIALAGGSTPEPIYRELAKRPLPWKAMVFTFGDERCVPPTDPSSNYRMAHEAMLAKAAEQGSRVIRIAGELDPEKAATLCEAELRELAEQRNEEILRHDLVLLGLGDDGHTASLFPHTQALTETERWVAANHVLKLNIWRLTFTYPLLNAAKNVAFLVNDVRKERVIQEILAGGSGHPAEGVKPTAGSVTWLLGHKPEASGP
ncbi:MAG: 6-phosphogluconolactonase [Verrucomicrobiia bacterium]